MEVAEIVGESLARMREAADQSLWLGGYGVAARVVLGLGSLVDRAEMEFRVGDGLAAAPDEVVKLAWETARHLDGARLGGTGKVFLMALEIDGKEVLRLAEPDEPQEEPYGR